MEEILLIYRDSSGVTSERRISDFQVEGRDAIDAYCHTRNARRTFKVLNIIAAIDTSTGEIIPNHWKAFNLSVADDGRERLFSILAERLAGIKALKFFALSTRGFSKREKTHLVNFIKQSTEIAAYTDLEIEDWLQKLWCGDIYAYSEGRIDEYQSTLNMIPKNQILQCRTLALSIALGSGRRQIPPELLERINRDFDL